MSSEQWKVVCYESGTMNVVDTLGPKVPFAYGMSRTTPWLYIFGPGGSNQSESDSNRYKVCEDIAAFLNGGARPAWLDDMERINEDHAIGLDRTSITATGPCIDRDPPKCWWVDDKSPEACNARARLMDRLFMVAAE